MRRSGRGVACLPSLLLAFAQDPTTVGFVVGDTDALEARVVTSEAIAGEASVALVEIEVRNTGDIDAEALAFELDPGSRGPPVRILRVEAPHYGRSGRVAPAGGSIRYPLVLPFDPRQARKLEVRVQEASFVEGGQRWEELPLVVGRLEVTREVDPIAGKTLARTTVAITNRIELTVDAIFRAEFTDPLRCDALISVRLAPASTTVHVQDRIPLGANYYYMGAAIRRLELVDWSVIADHGHDRGRALLEEVWRSWRRVDPELFPLAATCTFDRLPGDPAETEEAGGLVQFSKDGTFAFDFAESLTPAGRQQAESFLHTIAWELTRPPLGDVLVGQSVVLQRLSDTSIVTITDPPFDPNAGEHHLLLRDGRVTGDASAPLGGGLEARWVTEDAGDGWRVVERAVPYASHDPDAGRFERFEWTAGTDLPGLAVRRENLEYLGAGTTELLLTFEGWTTNAPPLTPRGPRPAPTGELADRLREAWDGIHRHPDPAATLKGRYRIRTPGTDGVWIGRRDVRGTFDLAHMRGGFWREARAEVEGKRLTVDERATLENAVLDRFLMWSSRDPSRLPSFDSAFAGAALVPAGSWISVEGAPIAAVRLVDGRVAALRWRDGREVEVEWTRVKDALVAVEQRSGRETVRTRWKALDDGWILPTEVVFQDVFPDWGPERLELSHHAVEGSRSPR